MDMSYAAADGAWVSATHVVRIECDRCGLVLVSRWPMNDREEHEACLQHMRDKHKGTYRAAVGKP